MDYDKVLKFLLNETDYEVCSKELYGKDWIEVTFFVEDRDIKIVHLCIDELRSLPFFYLWNPDEYGQLAHVSIHHEELGSICVNDQDSISVNFERPELAFKESIERHIKLLTRLITDKDFNKHELLREFQPNWIEQTKDLLSARIKYLYCSVQSETVERLKLLNPKRNAQFVMQKSYVGLPYDRQAPSLEEFFECDKRFEDTNSFLISIPLGKISPFIERDSNGLKIWLHQELQRTETDVSNDLRRLLFSWRAKEFWLILNFTTPSGVAWIGVRLWRKNKKAFPQNQEAYKDWKIEPFGIENYNQDLILPRSGGNTTLSKKRALIVGCGSVGSEVAHKVASAGVGHLTLIDPDFYSTSNLYRHCLEHHYLYCYKTDALSHKLRSQFPWLECTPLPDRSLLDFRNNDVLKRYDIIIIAVGSPTHERLFHSYIRKLDSPPAVIYTWLEGYGIGGHAVLDLNKDPSCLDCAYVDITSGEPGLSSNLNFFLPDQDVVKNYAGCGEVYLPYGSIHSAQTALLASDLAISFLENKQNSSVKVSWKGSEAEGLKNEIQLSPRFHSFNSSLKKLPLRNPLCMTCNPSKGQIFLLNSCVVTISDNVLETIHSYRQTSHEDLEAAGLLIGFSDRSGNIWIDQITYPKDTDVRTRSSFKLDADAHQQEVDSYYEQTDGLLGYLGTWHTHPQDKPQPSYIDSVDWGKHVKQNDDRQLIFIIAGREKTEIFAQVEDEIIRLKKHGESMG